MRIVKTIDDTLLIPVLQTGDKLYHYTSAVGLKGICEGEFWVTERGFLNDSMEFQVATDVFCEVLDKHMNNKELCAKIQKKVRNEVERLQTPGLSVIDDVAFSGDYVISFCKDYDSPLMWSSYSDYIGYCIQFDFEKIVNLFEEKYNHEFLHGEVVYSHDYQVHLIEETINRSYFEWPTGFDYLKCWEDFDKMTDQNLEDWYMFVAMEVSAYNIFFKLPCFEGEQEYRFVFMAAHDGGRCKPEDLWKLYFKIKDEVLIPYIKVPFESLESIEKILVGAKNKSDIAVKGLKHFFRNLKHDVVIEQSGFPLRY